MPMRPSPASGRSAAQCPSDQNFVQSAWAVGWLIRLRQRHGLRPRIHRHQLRHCGSWSVVRGLAAHFYFLLSTLCFFHAPRSALCALNRPLLLPIIERRHGDFGVFRVGMMHRLGIVPQRLLREPLRVAALQSPFRPRIAIRVQRHARNFQPLATLTELRCPVTGTHGAKLFPIAGAHQIQGALRRWGITSEIL